MLLLDGKSLAESIHAKIKSEVTGLKRPPCLAVVLIGNNPASKVYVNRKAKACDDVGYKSIKEEYPETITQQQLVEVIQRLNLDPTIDGILVQLPLPEHIDALTIIKAINPAKDVDGFHPENMGKLLIGDATGFVPCTPLGICTMLQHYKIETTGKNAVIVGRSNIVGKPMAALLMQTGPGGNATVTVAHSKTKHLADICSQADILIAAIGRPYYIAPNMVKEGAVVVDVGMNRIDDSTKTNGYRLVGDVDFDHIRDKCTAITPVPGGVGPMTIAMLLQNTLQGYIWRNQF